MAARKNIEKAPTLEEFRSYLMEDKDHAEVYRMKLNPPVLAPSLEKQS